MKDPVGRGLIAGAAGVLAINLVEVLLMKLNISETPLWQAGGIVFLTEPALKTPLGMAIGIFSHIFIGLVLGTAIAYYISCTGKDFAVLKGTGLSLIAGFVVLTIIFPMRQVAVEMQSSPGDVLSALIDHSVFGALAGYTVKRLQAAYETENKARAKKDVTVSRVNYIRFLPKPLSGTNRKVVFRKPKKI